MSRHIIAALAIASLFPALTARAGVFDAVSLSSVLAVPGQADAGPEGARRQVDDLLSRARQAMQEGNLETADSLVARAEASKAVYGIFHTGDTPKKARRDLDKLREARGGAKPGASDPFASANRAPTAGAAPPGSAPSVGATSGGTTSGITPLPSVAATNEPGFAAPQGNQIGLPTAPNSLNLAAPTPVAAAPLNAAPLAGYPTAGAATPTGEPASSDLTAAAAQATSPAGNADLKQRTLDLVRQARGALAAGDLAQAETFAREAESLNVPDKEFGQQDDRAFLVLMDIAKQQRRGVVQAGAAVNPGDTRYPGSQALYTPSNDTTRNIPAAASVPGQMPAVAENQALKALNAGEEALRRRDTNTAQAMFRTADERSAELSPSDRQRLQDRLSLVAGSEPIAPGRSDGAGLIDQAAQSQALQMRQVSSEVAKLEQQARQLQETDPAQSQAILAQARVIVEKSTVDSSAKEMLLRRLDRDAKELNQFVDSNRPRIELLQQNRETQATLDREQANKLDTQNKLARLVEEYNTLVDQQRFGEAEVLAKRAAELAPNEPISVQLAVQSKALRRMFNAGDIRGGSEDNFVRSMQSIDGSGVPIDDTRSMTFARNWDEITRRRGKINGDSRRRSPKEMEIEQRLKTPVSLKFANAPMSQVFEKLSAVTGVPIYLDPRGLAAEGVDSSTPVTIDISTEISLKSALALILAPHHLTHVIKHEVLKITSDRMRSEEVYSVTYPVGDLVIPIPNFVPTNRMGLTGALMDAQASLQGGGALASMNAPISAMAGGGSTDPSVLAQAGNIPFGAGFGGGSGPAAQGSPQQIGFGPGGMGGGVKPDFDSLVELMTSTIEPESWREAGGTQGEVKHHTSTLSLVITQTQAVHEQIEDLLNQLRQLQDLQVTIEVRFIRLSDNFYEQIGIDFDAKLNDNTDSPFQIFGKPNTLDASQIDRTQYAAANALNVGSGNPPRDVSDRDLKAGNSATVGMSAPGVFSSDLDIPFNQNSLITAAGALSAIPGVTLANGLAPGGAEGGFAILSDLEAYFFIKAVQDDNRSNVLQAPKVTMFNGQQAFVSDTAQSPFVVSVIPVVGDFAAAQQPVIVVLNEGTSLSVQAVVSNDRRFVRLTLVPFFSQIGDVNTFTFEGTSTSRSTSSSETQGPGTQSDQEEEEVVNSGTTVQLPTFAFQTVTTTVSVPDGGTVLLGGIKRMTEVRRENGVPMLSKIPYINRLFENVAIGKASESLMMMVTPRIIIQSEEEEAIGVVPSGP
jgi:general secretion pathway protein D